MEKMNKFDYIKISDFYMVRGTKKLEDKWDLKGEFALSSTNKRVISKVHGNERETITIINKTQYKNMQNIKTSSPQK